jgi:hypothetical protein
MPTRAGWAHATVAQAAITKSRPGTAGFAIIGDLVLAACLVPDQRPPECVEILVDVGPAPFRLASLGGRAFECGLATLPQPTVEDHVHGLAEQMPEILVPRRFRARHDDDEYTCHEYLRPGP